MRAFALLGSHGAVCANVAPRSRNVSQIDVSTGFEGCVWRDRRWARGLGSFANPGEMHHPYPHRLVLWFRARQHNADVDRKLTMEANSMVDVHPDGEAEP